MIPVIPIGATHKLTGSGGVLDVMARYDGETLTTVWEPTPAEVKLIMAGAKIELVVLGEQMPPVKLQVGPT